MFRREGDLRETDADPPGPFAQDALEFLELLAVSHRVPIVCLAAVHECLSRSACRLLGQGHNHGGVQWGRPVHRFDPFAEPLAPRTEAVAEARTAYGERKSGRYAKLAPVGPEPEFASWAAIWRSGFPEALESRARNSRRRL